MSSRFKFGLVILFVIGVLLRLPNLDSPREIIFDEIYFGKFATSYCCSYDSIFDIHPPHAKLLIAGTAKLFGHQPGFDFKGIGTRFTPEFAVFGMRLIPALAGALIPCFAMIMISQLGGGIAAAFFGGFLLTWESAFWIQSRIITLDSILIAFFLAALIAAIWSLQKESISKRCVGLLGCGALSGLAVGSKFTGLACLPLIGVLLIWGTFRAKNTNRFLLLGRYTLWFASGFSAIYLAGWWIHFRLLNLPGPGDAFFRPSGRFFQDVVDLHRIMFEKNAGITTLHPYASHWYEWPIMKRPVFYWNAGDRFIYLLGNPVVWYGVFVAFLASAIAWTCTVAQLFLHRDWLGLKHVTGTFSFSAVAVCFMPLMQVARPLFLYHYFPTFVFMTISSCLVLPNIAILSRFGRNPIFKHVYIWACIMTVLGFIAVLPMTGMTNLASGYRDWVYFQIPSWR